MDNRTQMIEQLKMLRELQKRKARRNLRDFLNNDNDNENEGKEY